jgi:hypothetical protein
MLLLSLLEDDDDDDDEVSPKLKDKRVFGGRTAWVVFVVFCGEKRETRKCV